MSVAAVAEEVQVEKAFVINLARRRDRWEEVKQILEPLIACPLERFEAVDGRELAYDEALMRRINPWNVVAPGKVKSMGVIGCCLSHLGVWERCRVPDKWYLVFEDDVVGSRLELPRQLDGRCGLLWLNDVKAAGDGIVATHTRPCTDAYLVRGACAADLHAFHASNLGAVDEHMRQFFAQSGEWTQLSLLPAPFSQKGGDTDIQRRDYPPITRFLPAFVINLDRRPDRMEQFKRRCPLPVSRVSGVDGRTLDSWNEDAHAKACVLNAGLRRRGEAGCFLSHAKVWRMMIDKRVPFLHVFEDDALFCTDYQPRLQAVLAALPHDFFVCYVGGRFQEGVRTAPGDAALATHDHDRPWNPPQDDRTTHSYILSFHGAKLLYNHLPHAAQEVDKYMLEVFRQKRLPIHNANPLLNWSPRVGDSDIR